MKVKQIWLFVVMLGLGMTLQASTANAVRLNHTPVEKQTRLQEQPLPYLAIAKKCVKTGSSKAEKAKFLKCQLKEGKKVEAKGCRLGGCHSLDAPNRLAGLTREEFAHAVATQPMMSNLNIRGRDLSYLLKYLATLE